MAFISMIKLSFSYRRTLRQNPVLSILVIQTSSFHLLERQKVKRGRYYYLEAVMGRKLDPSSKNTWALNMKSQAQEMHHLLMSLRTQGILVITLPSEIILLQWEGHETAWVEVTTTQLKRISTSQQRGQIIQMSDL